MPRPKKIDLSLVPKVLSLSVPLALAGQLENLVGFADIYMVGALGPTAISAVGISRVVIMVIGVTLMAVLTGTFTVVAQAIGAGSMRDASTAGKQSFTLVAIFSVAISLLGILAAPSLLSALSDDPRVVSQGTSYLSVFFSGLILMALNYTITTCLHAAGDTRTPLLISVFMNTIKIFASYLLIFGIWGLPRLGVAGAAVGTVIARCFGLSINLWVAHSGRFRFRFVSGTTFRPEPALARRILRIGIPSALQGFFRNGSNLVFVKLVALTRSSTSAVAAYSIGNQMERVLRRTSLAFGTAATALVGQNLGAGHPERANQQGWTTLFVAVIVILGLGLTVTLFAHPIMGRFTDDADVTDIGILYLYAMALAEPFMCTSIASGGGLRGAGDTLPPLYYTLIAQWLIRLPVAYLLAFPLGQDVRGIWTSLVVFSALQGGLSLRKYAKGQWMEKRI